MHERGRWPANVVLDEDPRRRCDEQTGELSSARTRPSAATSSGRL